MIRFHERLAKARRIASGEEGAALITTVLFMIMLAGASMLLLGVIVGQLGPAYYAQKGTKTVYAAQAGLQAALGTIRSAAGAITPSGEVFGDPRNLPCEISGSVDGADLDAIYDVEIRYYLMNPEGQDESWLNAHKLGCASGSGVPQQPLYAYVVSTGGGAPVPGATDASVGNRRLAATYQFKVTNVNIPGGLIYDFNRSQCLEAIPNGPGSTVTDGARIRYVAAGLCSQDKDLQKWVYDTDYKIKFAASLMDGGPGLCITGPVSDNSQQDAQLLPCRTGNDRNVQLWSWEGSHTWWGQNSPINNGRSNWCLTRSNNTIGGGGGGGGGGGHYRLQVKQNGCTTFGPTPAVGAGAASAGTRQIVNYQEFGRCLDVTGENINSTFMIDYPCKQDPTGLGTHLNWNHKWFYDEVDIAAGQVSRPGQEIYVYVHNSTSQKRCLQAPNNTGGYPVFRACNNGANQKWERVYNTGDYAGSYLFTDFQGRCLAANPDDRLDGAWSKIVVAHCNGSELQKWNAPASYNEANFGGYKELG